MIANARSQEILAACQRGAAARKRKRLGIAPPADVRWTKPQLGIIFHDHKN
jgi:hypothetical protein